MLRSNIVNVKKAMDWKADKDHYCLTACLYAKCWNLIGWIMEHGPSTHFRIDGPDRLYGFRSKLK